MIAAWNAYSSRVIGACTAKDSSTTAAGFFMTADMVCRRERPRNGPRGQPRGRRLPRRGPRRYPFPVGPATPISRWKRIIGYILVGFGVLSVLDFFSPIPIPTTFLGAFFTGGIAIVAGAWMLTGGGWLVYLKRWAATRDRGSARKPDAVKFDPLLPVEILRLARERGGLLTVSNVSIELNVPLDQAGAALEECVRRGNAFPDYDIDRQHAVYRFPEFMPPREQLGRDEETH